MRVPIDSIVVHEGRFRGATGDIEGLCESFRRFGQLQPVILSEDGELLAGFRRLTAATKLGWTEIDAVHQLELSPLQKKEVELEENIQRENMKWHEIVEARAQLHALKVEMYPEKWSQSDTAQLAGTERSRIAEAVKLSKMMELFPELRKAKSINQAESWAKAKAASVMRVKEVKDAPKDYSEIEDRIVLGDSVEVVKSLPSEQFRLILTDPPFGINYDERKAGVDQAITAYKDDEESYRRLLGMAEDLYRVLQADGWLVWFLGPTWYERAKGAFREVGFTVDEMPIVWDRSDGRSFTARPDRYFARAYDIALHCLKGNPEMVQRGKPNIIRVPPVQDRDLLVERPVELYQELIRRLTVPGETVADFFVGSGSVPAAAASLGRAYWGCELDPERRAVAIKKIRAHTPDGN